MKFSFKERISLGFANVAGSIADFALRRPSIEDVVFDVTNDRTLRKISQNEKPAVLAALRQSGYKDAEGSLAAFETASEIDWSNVPR